MQLEVPKELITTRQLQELRSLRMPSFVPVGPDVNETKVYDEETGITQRKLSNGIPVNYKVQHHIHVMCVSINSSNFFFIILLELDGYI